jgi:hypothetical protein
MIFSIDRSLEILHRTPAVVGTLLNNISPFWSDANEGEKTFSPYDVVGHLIHGEKTDWIERIEIILSDQKEKRFKPFDRFAQYHESKGKTLEQLIKEFEQLRAQNLEKLENLHLNEKDLTRKATHPALGEVTLQQLLSTWTVHDLNHISQIVRVMSKRYIDEVGPWKEYLPLLTR